MPVSGIERKQTEYSQASELLNSGVKQTGIT